MRRRRRHRRQAANSALMAGRAAEIDKRLIGRRDCGAIAIAVAVVVAIAVEADRPARRPARRTPRARPARRRPQAGRRSAHAALADAPIHTARRRRCRCSNGRSGTAVASRRRPFREVCEGMPRCLRDLLKSSATTLNWGRMDGGEAGKSGRRPGSTRWRTRHGPIAFLARPVRRTRSSAARHAAGVRPDRPPSAASAAAAFRRSTSAARRRPSRSMPSPPASRRRPSRCSSTAAC